MPDASYATRASMRGLAGVLWFLLLSGCSGGGGADKATGPTTPPVDLTKPTGISAVAGTGQTVRINSAVPNALTFKVTNAVGSGLPGITVSFAVTAGGGTLASQSGTTGTDGSVTMPAWTVGPSAVANTVTASVNGTLTASATVTARLPYWTVMVYMAADNTLAAFGKVNLAQMANAGVNPEVQVVVQAEFSPFYFAQAGFTPATVDRPNYDTFRYVMDGSVSRPPNNVLIGPATDIGNVNMTDPAQLRAFVQWANQTAPSQHTVLVLWNHGGDAQGLIQDETSAPGAVMSLAQLTSALTGFGTFDVLDFEMCLMGGYEPLTAVRGLAQTVVASEEEEIVNGWDFSRFLQAIYAAPTASATTVAGALADAFDAAYVGSGFSETISAYNMSGFSAVDAAVSQLGNALLGTSATNASAIASASASAQRFGYPYTVDVVDLSDSLRAHVADSAVVAAAAAVRQAVTAPTFLLANHSRTGSDYQSNNVSRSRGLQIVMPASTSTEMPSSGPASLASYEQDFPSTTWSAFLQKWVPTLQSRAYVDLGANTVGLLEYWNDTLTMRGGNIQMLLIEPDGSVSGPALGTLSPSGQFSADDRQANVNYEGWASNRYVEGGEFYFLAWLAADPSNYQPQLNVLTQTGGGTVQSLYHQGTYPSLSLQRSFFADPSPSFSHILANDGYYTDLKIVATWNTGAPVGERVAQLPTFSRESIAPDVQTPRPTLTSAQVAAIRRALTDAGRPKHGSLDSQTQAIVRRLQRALATAPRIPQ